MGNIAVLNYLEANISFELREGEVFANATEMCRAFGKQPTRFINSDKIQRYVKALESKVQNCTLVEVRRGGVNNGTWIHEKLILKLAQWLDVYFEIWCDEQIAKILSGELRGGDIDFSRLKIRSDVTKFFYNTMLREQTNYRHDGMINIGQAADFLQVDRESLLKTLVDVGVIGYDKYGVQHIVRDDEAKYRGGRKYLSIALSPDCIYKLKVISSETNLLGNGSI